MAEVGENDHATDVVITDAKDEFDQMGSPVVSMKMNTEGARLRPILMTSLAMVIGLLPLMFASGVGKNGNQTLVTSAGSRDCA